MSNLEELFLYFLLPLPLLPLLVHEEPAHDDDVVPPPVHLHIIIDTL